MAHEVRESTVGTCHKAQPHHSRHPTGHLSTLLLLASLRASTLGDAVEPQGAEQEGDSSRWGITRTDSVSPFLTAGDEFSESLNVESVHQREILNLREFGCFDDHRINILITKQRLLGLNSPGDFSKPESKQHQKEDQKNKYEQTKCKLLVLL